MEGKYQEAVAELKKALQVGQDDLKFRAQVLVNLGGLIKDADQAIDYLQQAMKIDPEYAAVWVNLGVAQEKKGKTAEAVSSYEKSIQLDPKNHWAMTRLARTLMLAGDRNIRDPERAVKLAATANILTGFNNIAVMEVLAGAYSEAGSYSKALEVAGKALELARKRGARQQAMSLEKEIELYLQNKPFSAL